MHETLLRKFDETQQKKINLIDKIIHVMNVYVSLVKESNEIAHTFYTNGIEFKKKYFGKGGISDQTTSCEVFLKNNFNDFIEYFGDAFIYFKALDSAANRISSERNKFFKDDVTQSREFQFYRQVSVKGEGILKLTARLKPIISLVTDQDYKNLEDFLSSNNAVINKFTGKIGSGNFLEYESIAARYK